jgi:hypothetical protein
MRDRAKGMTVVELVMDGGAGEHQTRYVNSLEPPTAAAAAATITAATAVNPAQTTSGAQAAAAGSGEAQNAKPVTTNQITITVDRSQAAVHLSQLGTLTRAGETFILASNESRAPGAKSSSSN